MTVLLGIGCIVAFFVALGLLMLLWWLFAAAGCAGLIVACVVAFGSLVQGHDPPNWVNVLALAGLGASFLGVLGSGEF